MKMNTKVKIEKFISDNQQSEIVIKLFAASDNEDESSFIKLLENIKKCIELQDLIYEYSQNITNCEKAKNACEQRLKKLKNGHKGKSKSINLFLREGLNV